MCPHIIKCLSPGCLVEVVQKALTEGNLEVRRARRKKGKKNFLCSPRTPCTEASSECPQPPRNADGNTRRRETSRAVAVEFWQYKWNQKDRQPRLAALEFQFSLLQRKFPILIPFMWELVKHSFLSALSACHDIFHSSSRRLAIQARFHCRKRKQTSLPTEEPDTVGLVLMECSVDFVPRALCVPFAAGYFLTCEKRLSFQQSRTYLMNGGRGLRWKRILIALIARIQAFKNDLDSLTPSHLCCSIIVTIAIWHSK